MSRGDFNYIPVNQTLNANNPVVEIDFPIVVGDGRTISDDGYLLITVRSVDAQSHRIRINNRELGGFDVPLPPDNSDAWFTYMDRIEPGVLRPGINELQIRRIGDDNFVVRDMVIHWRERPS
ncbi:hypothetical protein SLH49_01090 [Cognatiyoonia sp. IB215446]|uniref:DUF7383 domain-containing protein n=1 Tax=Cognatiyoonia sp. IB215446 TaxID=3097355 RepID=UPI002A0FFF1E|nr:hypothetical protein [Cognatiyoonia sp. IB215446]MDX8346565.1 hypothetical protein [Cognatiyoonia sp. IB215446]